MQRASLRVAGARDGSFTGRLRMGAPGALAVDDWQTTLTRLDATLGLRGSVLTLEPLTIGTTDGEISMRGTAGLSADAPREPGRRAPRSTSRASCTRSPAACRWRERSRSRVARRAPSSEPSARLAVRAPALTWGALAPGVLAGNLVVTRHEVQIPAMRLDAPWGRATVTGRISDPDSRTPSRLDVTFKGRRCRRRRRGGRGRPAAARLVAGRRVGSAAVGGGAGRRGCAST